MLLGRPGLRRWRCFCLLLLAPTAKIARQKWSFTAMSVSKVPCYSEDQVWEGDAVLGFFCSLQWPRLQDKSGPQKWYFTVITDRSILVTLLTLCVLERRWEEANNRSMKHERGKSPEPYFPTVKSHLLTRPLLSNVTPQTTCSRHILATLIVTMSLFCQLEGISWQHKF